MNNSKNDNVSVHHNATITARPAILMPAVGQMNDGWVIQMGTSGPGVQDFSIDSKGGGPRYANWDLEPFQTVREFTSAYLNLGSTEHREMESLIKDKDWKTLKQGLAAMRYSHATFPTDAKEAKYELSKASQKLIADPDLRATFAGGQLPKITAWFYPAFFNREVKGARLVLWLTRLNQFVPAIYCPTMRMALFAASAFGRIAFCLNCGELFDPDSERIDGSNSEKYHTAVCGQRYRQKLYRLRLQQESKKPDKGPKSRSR